uniref:Uncharacterized protein n=1 Tax=Nelumbo nucifera TaxID=4432 RepID=A0A822ZL25_NELNU|nr:TPA_asm: hypothetical protein HUJ06_003430 [Nelumbo nucifera]
MACHLAGGWCRQARRNNCASEFSHAVLTMTNPNNIEWKTERTCFKGYECLLFICSRQRT